MRGLRRLSYAAMHLIVGARGHSAHCHLLLLLEGTSDTRWLVAQAVRATSILAGQPELQAFLARGLEGEEDGMSSLLPSIPDPLPPNHPELNKRINSCRHAGTVFTA